MKTFQQLHSSNSTSMRFTLSLVLAACLLALQSCGGGPRYKVIPWAKAKHLDAIMEMRIIDIHDGLHYSREQHVTHLVSVEILEGPESIIGQRITLPYDSYNTGKKPPGAGTVVTLAPSSWLKRNYKAFGRSN